MRNCIYQNLPVDEVKKHRKESREKFKLIYEKTLEVLKLDETSAPCSGGFQQCWYDLLDIWSSNAQHMNCVVMNSVMHHIAWGWYPGNEMSKELQDLLLLVEKAVLEEGYAFEVWLKSGVLRRELNFVREMCNCRSELTYCNSRWFGRYVYSRTFSQVRLKKRKIASYFEGMEREDYYIFGTAPRARDKVHDFENAIKALLPGSKSWSKTQWSDEKWIMQEIYRVHGVDYSQDFHAFDELVDVFVAVQNGRSYDRSLLLLDAFPESMLVCLWPRDTQLKLERFFLRVAKRTRKQMKTNPNTRAAFRTSVLTNSWVWRYYSNSPATCSNKVKTEQFNVQLGI